MMRGRCHLQKNNFGNAAQDFSKAIQLKPDDGEAYRWLGKSLVQLGNSQQALVNLNRAVELNSQDDANYKERGRAYATLGEYDKAIADYSRAIALKPDIAESYQLRAEAYHLKGEEPNSQLDLELASCAIFVAEMPDLNLLIPIQNGIELSYTMVYFEILRNYPDELIAKRDKKVELPTIQEMKDRVEVEMSRLQPTIKKSHYWKILGVIISILVLLIHLLAFPSNLIWVGWLLALLIVVIGFVQSSRTLPKWYQIFKTKKNWQEIVPPREIERLYKMFGRGLSSRVYIAMRDERINYLASSREEFFRKKAEFFIAQKKMYLT